MSLSAEYDQLLSSGRFDPDYYLSCYPDVAQSGMDPFLHYVLHGAHEGRRPGPDPFVDAKGPDEAERDPAPDDDIAFVRQVVAQAFDAAFYLDNYADVRDGAMDPLEHYLHVGWHEGRQPRADFDGNFYIAANPDVASAGVNPFFHYLVAGKEEGRLGAAAASDKAPPRGDAPAIDPFVRTTVARHFDAEYYLAKYPDVRTTGVDPLDHYLTAGWREGRDPTRSFDASYYLENNQDVREAGVEPFYHYLVAGRDEGRSGRDELAIELATLTAARPPREARVHWLQRGKPLLLDATELAKRFRRHCIAKAQGTCVALSHDHYLQVVGGVQNCLRDEQARFNALKFNYLQAFPVQPLPMLSDVLHARHATVVVTLNGRTIGAAALSSVADAMAAVGWAGRARQKRPRAILAVHSLLGHSPEAVAQFARKLALEEAYFWIHDYGSLCGSFTLLRNDVTFCAAPGVESSACGVCVYGEERRSHLRRMEKLFDALVPVVLSPSQAALDVWRNASASLKRAKEVVLAHCELAPASTAVVARSGGPVRIGYLGFEKYHKGWATFVRLVEKFAGDKRYEFFHLGTISSHLPGATFVPVSVTPSDRDAMVRAVQQARLDAVVVWPAWPETYSFVAYEALAGGASLLTHRNSGNVASLVEQGAQGWALESEEELHRLLASGGIKRRRPRNGSPARTGAKLVYSGCTAALFGDAP